LATPKSRAACGFAFVGFGFAVGKAKKAEGAARGTKPQARGTLWAFAFFGLCGFSKAHVGKAKAHTKAKRPEKPTTNNQGKPILFIPFLSFYTSSNKNYVPFAAWVS
jgi:hypothetical protein